MHQQGEISGTNATTHGTSSGMGSSSLGGGFTDKGGVGGFCFSALSETCLAFPAPFTAPGSGEVEVEFEDLPSPPPAPAPAPAAAAFSPSSGRAPATVERRPPALPPLPPLALPPPLPLLGAPEAPEEAAGPARPGGRTPHQRATFNHSPFRSRHCLTVQCQNDPLHVILSIPATIMGAAATEKDEKEEHIASCSCRCVCVLFETSRMKGSAAAAAQKTR